MVTLRELEERLDFLENNGVSSRPGVRRILATSEWLRVASQKQPEIQVDRGARVLRGIVLAQKGPFKTEGRGEFDRPALEQIVRLGNQRDAGLKSRFAHPTLSEDGLGKYLGRVKDLRLAKTKSAEGEYVEAVRGDLHFDSTASATPSGDLAGYVLSLAESDPDALSSSLVLQADQNYRLDKRGLPAKGEDGEELPPLWWPTKLHAADIVDTGEAVDGLLSVGIDDDALPDAVVRRGAELLDRMFPNADPEVILARCTAWLGRYLQLRFGTDGQAAQSAWPVLRQRLRSLDEMKRWTVVQQLGPGLSHDSVTSDSEPAWAAVDKTKLPRVAFADHGEADKKSSWGYPHHWVSGGTVGDQGIYTSGTLYLHKGGLNAAWAAAQGARSGQKASSAVISHLQAHRRALGLED
jgi:hypothetical protein